MATEFNRRQFLLLSAAGVLTPSLLLNTAFADIARTILLIGAAKTINNDFCIAAINTQGELRYSIALPARAHATSVRADGQHAICMARRPGFYAVLFNPHDGKTLNILTPPKNHHYYGHACYSADGQHILITEGNINSEGIIGIYQANAPYQRIHEWRNIGIGPHELLLNPTTQHLVVAVGGIRTEWRENINIADMQPALLFLNSQTGELLKQHTLNNSQLSIRHLASTKTGDIIIGTQYEGSASDNPSLVYRANLHTLQALPATTTQWTDMNHYIGSVATADSQILATSPRGNAALYWADANAEPELINMRDVCAACPDPQQGFWLGSGTGLYRHLTSTSITASERSNHEHLIWDNHWVSLQSTTV
ncbi:MAG: DUF1513 domain-containing protein [Gammaproteobacteria bacterium]|nr:DUF1513 domain-containing protein [Gammaproteobacteria bacterium]